MPPAVIHEPVLVSEVVRFTVPGPGAVVVDCTFGAGGHARRIGPLLGVTGTYVAVDRDPDVQGHVEAFAADAPCAVRYVRANYADALGRLAEEGLTADIVLMDLGVSSMQIDRTERGFSYARQAPLDMRMDPDAACSAADLVASSSEAELVHVFRTFGEERHARPIARAIVRRREDLPITTTADLVEVIRGALPTPALFAGGHPAKRVFQALRIAVNDELDSLEAGLSAAFDLLVPGGRLAVIAFHSLEDRIVKRFMADRARGCECPPDLPACVCDRVPAGVLVTPKAVRPRAAEIEENPRARSARLRVIERALPAIEAVAA